MLLVKVGFAEKKVAKTFLALVNKINALDKEKRMQFGYYCTMELLLIVLHYYYFWI